MLNNPESNLENTNTQSASMENSAVDNSVAKDTFSVQTPDENKQAVADAQKSKTPYAKYVIVAVPVDKESVPEMLPIVQEVTLGEGIVTPSTVKAENYCSTNITLGSGYKIYAEPIPDTVIQEFLAEPEITESSSAVQVEIVGDGVKKEGNGTEPALIEEQTTTQNDETPDDNTVSDITVAKVAVETDSVLLVAEENTSTEDNQVEESSAEEPAQTEDTADNADKTFEEVAVTNIEGDKEHVAEEPMQNEETAEEQSAETTDSDGAPVYEVSRDFEIKEHVSVNEATKLMTDEDAKLLVEEEENVFPLGSVEKSSTYSDKSVKDIINIDAISANFKAGDLVTLETLKEHKLVGKRTTYIKVLARGVINKPLIVEADAFSIEAIKMIVLTGGRVIRKRSK